VRARLVVPLVVVLCSLAAATPALALPHLNKVQSRQVSDVVERWVDGVVRGRNLADSWKIAGPVERGTITHKAWVSGRELPVQHMRVRNNPRTSWYATGRAHNLIFLVVSLMTGRGKNRVMYDNETTLLKRHGVWYVNGFYTDGIFRLGAGHSGSCVKSSCKVTGIADYAAGAPSSGFVSGTARIGVAWGLVVIGAIFVLPLVALLTFALVRSRQARRARIAYETSRSA
jgi:hypothetical protein